MGQVLLDPGLIGVGYDVNHAGVDDIDPQRCLRDYYNAG
jgi:hypothetical protein